MKQFQSTLPARGATLCRFPPTAPHSNFNPRSPHGERRGTARAAAVCRISIHAPRTGSDFGSPGYCSSSATFQSTLPARGATRCTARRRRKSQFQSTLPARGATMTLSISSRRQRLFQSTLPARGATRSGVSLLRQRVQFQSTLPARERRFRRAMPAARGYFQSTLPHGERRFSVPCSARI